MKFLTRLGLSITGIWLLVLATVVCFKFADAGEMTLNEWGDFLAGTFAPLALLWLVIGYFQHGEELRLNTKALEMQQEELRKQVEETAHLVEANKDQARAMLQDLEDRRRREAMEAAPEFVSQGGGSSNEKIYVNLRNRGGEARNVELHYTGPHEIIFSSRSILESNEETKIMLIQKTGVALEFPIRLSISCLDRFGRKHHSQFDLSANLTLKKISPESASLAQFID